MTSGRNTVRLKTPADCHPENASPLSRSSLHNFSQLAKLFHFDSLLPFVFFLFFLFASSLRGWVCCTQGGNLGVPWPLTSDVHHRVSFSASTLCADALAPSGFGTRHSLPALHSVCFWMFSRSWRLSWSSLSALLHGGHTWRKAMCALVVVCFVCSSVMFDFYWRRFGLCWDPICVYPSIKNFRTKG